MSPAREPIAIRAHAVARLLGGIAAGLVAASVAGQLARHLGEVRDHPLVALFNVGSERNVPTFFSAVLHLLAAGLLALVAVARRRVGAPFARHWAVLALIFLGFAVDEASSMHELLNRPVRTLLDPHYVLYYAWVLPGAVFVAIIAVSYRRFVIALPRPTRRLVLAAATLFVGGAIGVEVIGSWIHRQHGWENLPYSLTVTLEESLEMAGMILFLYALLDYLETHLAGTGLRFGTVAAAASNAPDADPEGP